MGILLSCFNDDSSDGNLQQTVRRQNNSGVRNARMQPNVRDSTVPNNRESNATVTSMPSSETMPPIGIVNPLQRNLQTKLHPRKATSVVAVSEVKGVHTEPTFSNRPTVAHNSTEKQACKACGENDHLTESCRYFTRLCFHCREEGHINRMCPKRKRRGTNQKENRTQHNNYQPGARVQKQRLIHKQHGTKVQTRTKSVKS